MNYWKITRDTAVEFFNDDPMNYSASIAFYLIFSLPAILIITMTVAGSAYGDQVVRENMLKQISQLLGPESTRAINEVLANTEEVGADPIAKIIGIGTLVFSATTVFVSLQNGLNHIWGIKPRPEKNFLTYVLHRLLSLAMVISIGFLLMVSLVLDAVIVIFGDLLSELLSELSYYIISIINVSISLGVITLVFAMIFKILPDAEIEWRDVWIGAFVTTLLFTAGKYLLGFYLGNSTMGTMYGAAGSLVLLLIWVYYSSLIILAGAEFTYVYSKARGRLIKPDKHAVVIEHHEVENKAVGD